MRTVLTMPRGRLRPATADDLDTLLGLLHDEEVRRFLCDNTVLPRETVAAMLTQSTPLEWRSLGLWMIEQPPSGSLGVAELQPVSVEMGAVPAMADGIEPIIALRPECWGRGLAGEAIATLIQYARDSLGFAQLVAAVDKPNTRSQRMMKRCGFLRAGTPPSSRQRTRPLKVAAQPGHSDPILILIWWRQPGRSPETIAATRLSFLQGSAHRPRRFHPSG